MQIIFRAKKICALCANTFRHMTFALVGVHMAAETNAGEPSKLPVGWQR